MKKYIVATSLVALLAACSSNVSTTTPSSAAASNGWTQLHSWLNVVEDATALTSKKSIALDTAGLPYVTWYEQDPVDNNSNVYVKKWDGTQWVRLGNALDIDITAKAIMPTIAMMGDYPVVSWSELNAGSYNIYAKRWNGTKWIRLSGALDVNLSSPAEEPYITTSNGSPTVTWTERTGATSNIYFKYWNGSAWVQLGGSISNGNGINPSSAASSSGLAVSWTEYVGSNRMVYTKKWNGSSWAQLGGALNLNTNRAAYHSTVALNASGNPVVAWAEDDSANTSNGIYVKSWNGSAWVQMGGVLDVNSNQNSFNPSIAFDAGVPTVTWDEATNGHYKVYVKTWNGSSWAQQGGAVDSTALWHAQKPSVAKLGSNLYVTWYQDGMDVMVAKFN